MVTTIVFGILIVLGSCKALTFGVKVIVKGLQDVLGITVEVSDKAQPKSEEA